MVSVADTASTPAAFRPDERAPRHTLVLYALLGVLLVVGSVAVARLVGEPAGAEHLVVIPEGTAAAIAAGERVELLPADLHISLRDTLVVVNDDVAVHQVGPFSVAPGQRLEKRFSEAATYEGACSLHPSGNISITIGGS